MLSWSPSAKENEVLIELQGPNEIKLGSLLNTTINVTNISSFDAANLDIVFNSNYLSVKNVSNGNIDNTIIPVSMWKLIDENTLRIIINLPGVSGINGSGTLAKIQFLTLSTGSLNINIEDIVLSNTKSAKISSKTSSYELSIIPADKDPAKNEKFDLSYMLILMIIVFAIILIALYKIGYLGKK